MEHGTTLTEGSLASFVGAGAKAFATIASRLGPDRVNYWGRNRDEDLQRTILEAPRKTDALFQVLGTVTIPATTERFVARDKFILNYGKNAKPGVRISYLDDNFSAWFLDKVEEPATEITIRCARLTRSELDGPITAELGDHKETTLAQIYWLMERQPNGDKGRLLTNGWATVFYAPDVNGVLRAVVVGWRGLGWIMCATSVEYPSGWRDGAQVFSRNSLVAVAV